MNTAIPFQFTRKKTECLVHHVRTIFYTLKKSKVRPSPYTIKKNLSKKKTPQNEKQKALEKQKA